VVGKGRRNQPLGRPVALGSRLEGSGLALLADHPANHRRSDADRHALHERYSPANGAMSRLFRKAVAESRLKRWDEAALALSTLTREQLG
jgi:hypothetical protein